MQVNLSKNDTAICKGIAMLMIVCHNFFHSLPNSPGENEFAFHWFRFFEVWLQIADNPFDVLRPISSFFGHYGVHVFMFLSGYGLTRKVFQKFPVSEEGPSLPDLYRLVFAQVLKLWKLILLGGGFAALIWWGSLADPEWCRRISEFLWTITFTNSVIPDHRYYFISVWWFFSLIVQFYIVFPFLFKYISVERRSFIRFLVLSILLGTVFYSPLRHCGVAVYATILGQAPIFAFGIWLAKGGDFTLKGGKTLTWLLILLLAGWTLRPFFHLSFLFVVVAFVCFYESMKVRLDCCFFKFIGGLSSFIFIVHGEIRRPIFKWLATLDPPSRLIEYGGFFVYFLIVILSAMFLRWFSSKLNWLGVRVK